MEFPTSSVFNCSQIRKVVQLDFDGRLEQAESARGGKKRKKGDPPLTSFETDYFRRMKKCQEQIKTRKMTPTNMLYAMINSGGKNQNGFNTEQYRIAQFLCIKAHELTRLGSEMQVACPQDAMTTYILLCVLMEYVKCQPTDAAGWFEPTVSLNFF